MALVILEQIPLHTGDVRVKTPSGMTWGLQDISDEDAGRTTDNVMHKNRTGQKRKLQLEWQNPTFQEAAAIMQAFNPEYIHVRYPDLLTGGYDDREFYVGDRTAPYKFFTVGDKRMSSVSFDIIER